MKVSLSTLYSQGSRIDMPFDPSAYLGCRPLVRGLALLTILSPARTRLTSNQHRAWLKHIGTLDHVPALADSYQPKLAARILRHGHSFLAASACYSWDLFYTRKMVISHKSGHGARLRLDPAKPEMSSLCKCCSLFALFG
jgi:hypothetical protein